MRKKNLSNCNFYSLGSLQADMSQSTYSCFIWLCVHFLSSSCFQGGTSSQHSDTTWKVVQQEFPEVSLCNKMIDLPAKTGISSKPHPTKLKDQIWSEYDTLLVSITITETISLGFSTEEPVKQVFRLFKTMIENAHVCASLVKTHSLQIETWGPKGLGFVFCFVSL